MVCRKTSGSDTSDRSGPECREVIGDSTGATVSRAFSCAIDPQRPSGPSAHRKRAGSISRVFRGIRGAWDRPQRRFRHQTECA